MTSDELRFGATEGQRREDDALLKGQGRFTDDVNLDGQAYAAFVRIGRSRRHSRHQHRRRAHPCPACSAICADAATDGLGGLPPAISIPGRDGAPMVAPPMPVLAADRVHVGEGVAIVVAETRSRRSMPPKRSISIWPRCRRRAM